MAISAATLAVLASTTNAATYNVATSRAPAANTLVLVYVSGNTTSGAIDPSSVSGAGMVFSLVTSVGYNTIATPLTRASVWRSMSATPNTSGITAAFSHSITGCHIHVYEFSGVSKSGTSGANAVGSSRISNVNATSSITLFLPSFASTANAAFVSCDINANSTADTPSSQFVEMAQGSNINPNHGSSSGWTSSSVVTQSVFSGGGAVDRGAIAVEIVADNPPTGGAGYYNAYYYPHVVCSIGA